MNKCDNCGHTNVEKSKSNSKDPWCMYHMNDSGAVINDMFHPDLIPDGWYDSPGAAKEGKIAELEAAKMPKHSPDCDYKEPKKKAGPKKKV